MAKVSCSIEMEPRTLNEGQLTHAREMAADVAQKMEPREASAIFIKGLISAAEMIKEVDEQTDEEKEVGSSVETEKHVDESNHQKDQMSLEVACQCSCNKIDSPDHPNNLKEPVTAPF